MFAALWFTIAHYCLRPWPWIIVALASMVMYPGLEVPRDIGLVCYDDVEHLAVLSPFMTVVDQPGETFGSLGAQLLFERIADKAGERSRRIVLQADLIVRDSCCAKTGVPRRPMRATAQPSA